jgi:hypothetical protein
MIPYNTGQPSDFLKSKDFDQILPMRLRLTESYFAEILRRPPNQNQNENLGTAQKPERKFEHHPKSEMTTPHSEGMVSPEY